MEADPICLEGHGNIALIRMNRPGNRNSMDKETLPAFQNALDRVSADPKVRCLVITGSGNTFCGGADFKSGVLERGGRAMDQLLLDVYRPFLNVGKLEIPVVAAMNGHAVGGGLGLALMCDVRVANVNARYGANFATLGLHSGMAISYVLPHLVGIARANELLLTGKIITGGQAAQMGLVNDAVDEEKVMETAMALARQMADAAPFAVRMMKQSIRRALSWDPEEAARTESMIQAHTFGMADSREGIAALLEKRKPVFSGE